MPPEKRGGDEINPESADGTAAPSTKRKRVSLACDACRAAREKCNGTRPQCGACVSQNRTCTYTPAAKKRGIQSGYLRTIELALSWLLFDQAPDAEEALYQLLKKDPAIFQNKCKASNRLHKKWSKSRINKEITSVLSDPSSQNQAQTSAPGSANTSNTYKGPTDTSEEDSDAEDAGEGTSVAPSNVPTANDNSPFVSWSPESERRSTNLKLPSGWRNLISIYFSYTHCWLPIVDKAQILKTGMEYPSEGIPDRPGVSSYYAELWAVLAIAAYQDASSMNPSQGELSPDRIYAIARSLVPSDERKFELPHLRALILHTVVLIGQGADVTAWMLVGTATRWALHLRVSNGASMDGSRRDEAATRSVLLALGACSILDTLIATCLGQSPSNQSDVGSLWNDIMRLHEFSEEHLWTPVPGFGDAGQDMSAPYIPVRPLKTFCQLLKFCQVLNRNSSMHMRGHNGFPSSTAAVEELRASLDPEYSFCNSVIFEGSTPYVPSAFVLQVAFLASSTRLIQAHSASLLSSLVEVVESSISAFGACGTPPIVVLLLGMIQNCGRISKMHSVERTKWLTAIAPLKQVWNKGTSQFQAPPSHGARYTPTTNQQMEVSPLDRQSVGSSYMQSEVITKLPEKPVTPQLGSQHGRDDLLTVSRPESLIQHTPSETGTYPQVVPGKTQTPQMGQANDPSLFEQYSLKPYSTLFDGGNDLAQHIDYDAILDELGSIDCTDGLEVHPQFMTNLGFAPDCDLGEMFQGDLGM